MSRNEVESETETENRNNDLKDAENTAEFGDDPRWVLVTPFK